MISKTTNGFLNIPMVQECNYCKQKASHVLVANGFFSGTRVRFVCEEHNKQWINGTLNI